MKFTVLGASGFIGSHLVRHLQAAGHQCSAVGRNDQVPKKELGHVVYCIGLTADFRSRWLDTVKAHVSLLAEFLADAEFASFLYLSSTRVYGGSARGSEDDALTLRPSDSSDLYNITKLAGESICFSGGHAGVRVARLSNVYGPDRSSENFLSCLIRDAVDKRRIVLHTAPESAKDYVSIDDVVRIIVRVAAAGKQRLYNVASGRAVANQALLARLQEITGCSVEVDRAAAAISFPSIDTSRISAEFGFHPRMLLDDLPALVEQYKAHS